ncbi:DNA-binding protein RHL1-like isoform X1 [Trifolium pratense]|uniref:DNA-binding protein RHL1-like isoform X1 n=1 Tax=Trifolium pratense TaxID=57577 RepID=UPI001E691A9A|nr:DNA-binding protein RHL1-like isoform X1 [Trifolium pratense]XP_045814442.1 DNA-binding protein RHL1-like isoform X1 [Trifolium pratense]
MARPKTKKKIRETEEDLDSTTPEAIERKRLKSLAFSNNILTETQARTSIHLNPSSIVAKHHGKDIIKKSQRKNSRYLFSFPGLFAPVAGGKIGELKDLGTKNPILYLDFPQGRMKLFGTILYPTNRYLTLQFSRGGKNVTCEDYFDNMIVFSDAWWIGTKDENPEETKLEFPKELSEGQQAEPDFKGGAGAGAASVVNQGVSKTKVKRAEPESPETPLEEDLSDSEIDVKDTKELVPVRQSARAAKKSYKFAEISSGESTGNRSLDISEHEEKAEVETDVNDHSTSNILIAGNLYFRTSLIVYSILSGNLYFIFLNLRVQKETAVIDIDDEDNASKDQVPVENKESASVSKSKKGSLVQATISSLFKKVEVKKASTNSKKSPSSSKASGQKLQPAGSKTKIEPDEGSKKRPRKTKDKSPGEKVKAKSKENEVEDVDEDDDDIEEFSNASEDSDGSDEDWAA